VRLVDEAGEQLGIVSTQEALKIARERELDLVEVASQADPPVCRIMNFAKWKYDEEQRLKEARKKNTNITVKEMKYRVKIGPGDFSTKTRKVGEFLREGHKVKVTIMFRGREVERPQFGLDILNRIAESVEDYAQVEFAPRLDGRNMTMVLAPGKAKKPKVLPTEIPEAETTDAEAEVAEVEIEVGGDIEEVSEGDANAENENA
jgi:translation initiation factor IF-3